MECLKAPLVVLPPLNNVVITGTWLVQAAADTQGQFESQNMKRKLKSLKYCFVILQHIRSCEHM